MLDMLSRPKNGAMQFDVVEITPSIAESWLTKNSKNRKKNARFVSRFARDMKSGDWQITGDSIKFDKAGNLVDGQHRLSACIESAVSFRSLVVYGLTPGTRDVVDTGKPRTNGDMLAMHGQTNSIALAAALKFLINEKRSYQFSVPATHSELLDALVRHPNINLYIPPAGMLPKGVSQFLVGYVNYVGQTLLHNKKSRAIAMVDVLKTGRPDYDGDPIHAYRERMIRSIVEKNANRRSINFNTFKHCWNLFAKREPLKSLKFLKSSVDIEGLDLDKL